VRDGAAVTFPSGEVSTWPQAAVTCVLRVMPTPKIATLPLDVDFETFRSHWVRSRAVLLRQPRRTTRSSPRSAAPLKFEAARRVLARHQDFGLVESFCAESKAASVTGKKRHREVLESHDVLGSAPPPQGSWYCSFIAQERRLVEHVSLVLPRFTPPCFELAPERVCQEQAIWWFVGRHNHSAANLPGRPEHTDAVQHDGTWHFQLEGAKEWRLRPTQEWTLEACRGRAGARAVKSRRPSAGERVLCEAGDILVVSTRDWWHATSIPPQADDTLSVSYAREFNLVPATTAADPSHDDASRNADDAPATFINVDGLFATEAIRAGTILMTEDDEGMKDAELPTSADPTCEVVEDENGVQCLVAVRDIRSGEFLSIAE